MQFGIAGQRHFDIAQAVALPEMSDDQRDELAPAWQGVAAPGAITSSDEFLEFKSRHGLEELGEYGRIISHSPVSCFRSMVCGELIVSKSATIPGYLLSLSGTAVQ